MIAIAGVIIQTSFADSEVLNCEKTANGNALIAMNMLANPNLEQHIVRRK